MEPEETEKPVRQALFRQSSLETRLYPEEDIDSSSDSDDSKENITEMRNNKRTSKPRIVSMMAKSPIPSETPSAPRRVSSLAVSHYDDHKPSTLRTRAEGTLDLREDDKNKDGSLSVTSQYVDMTSKKNKLFSANEAEISKTNNTASNISTSASENVEYSVPKTMKSRFETNEMKDNMMKTNTKLVSSETANNSPAVLQNNFNVVSEHVTSEIQSETQNTIGDATLRRVRFQEEKKKMEENSSKNKEDEHDVYSEIDESAAKNEVSEITDKNEDGLEYAEIETRQTASMGILKAVTAVTSTSNMASPRPKSPRPGNVSARGEKEESFWEKIGTLGRKKRIKEVQEVQDEGKYAIDSPGNPLAPDLPPEEYALEENEERSMISPQSFENPRLRELMAVLIEWINDELASHRIIVKDLEEDLYDGQVLHKLIETLTGERLDVPEVTQSEEGQRQKLGIVLATANRVLGLPRWSQQKWSVESIHSKNVITILHLLVSLARHFRAPVRLPERVAVQVVVVQMHNGVLSHRTVTEEITSTYDDLGLRGERDAFDTLFDHAPDKLQVVKKSLVTFVNKHLNKLGLEVTDLDTQFHDGVYLALLMGLLEGFFVPLYAFHNTPHDFDQKVQNVNLAFDLMQEVGLARPKARPEDIVNLDLKSTLRVLYNLFTKYKGMN